MILYSKSYLKLLVSASCRRLLDAKVRERKGEVCSYTQIPIVFRAYLSDWFYPQPQIEPTKRIKGLLEYNLSNSPFLRIVVKWLLPQCNTAHRSTLLSIGNLCIHLCCSHILVTEITLHNRNTCSCVQLETGKAVA